MVELKKGSNIQMIKYILNRAVSIREDEDKLYIGINPPYAFIIDNPPLFLKELLFFFNNEHTIEEAKNNFNEEINEVINELILYKVLVPKKR